MIVFFYNVLLSATLLVSLPWWLWRMATANKYREGLLERLGCVPRRLSNGGLSNGEVRVIWLHAVSVGEVLAVTKLVAEMDAVFPTYRLVISTTTRTGQTVARERFGAARVFYCPLDLPWAVWAYLAALRPAMLVLAETEFWPNLLSGCFRRGIPVLVANGRISDRSWPRYWRLRSVWRPFLSRLSRVLAQTGLDAERLLALGCERVTVSGNLKFDVRVSQPARATALLGALRGPLQLLVAGSTLEGEEALLLEAWPAVCGMPAESPAPLAMVIAPRHPERFPAVAALLAQSGHPWRRVSALGREPLRAGELLLLDSIGELASLYSLAAVAFVGGSLVNGGGHNPLEPAQFAVPVVMGPHFANFRAIVEAMRAADAIEIVKPEALERQLAGLLRDSGRAAALGQRGRAVFAAQTGATARTVAAIGELLGESGR